MNSQLRAWRLLALASHTVLLNPQQYPGPVTDPASAATDLTLALLNFLLSKEEALAGEIAGYTDKINGTVAHFWPGVSICSVVRDRVRRSGLHPFGDTPATGMAGKYACHALPLL